MHIIQEQSTVYVTWTNNELYIIQVNEKFFEIKRGHIGIVEKAQETSSDSDMHNTVCLCHCSTS